MPGVGTVSEASPNRVTPCRLGAPVPLPTLPASSFVHPLQAFDTAKRLLVPIGPDSGTARIYVCGITPYDATHIGHANTYVAFDLLNRVWRDRGLDVNYVQNVTDVDDPLLERAAATGVDWAALAEQQTQLFGEDMAALNVLPPRHYVGAVESIPLIVDLIEQLRRSRRSIRSTTASSRISISRRPVTRSSGRCPTSPRPRRSRSSPSAAVTRIGRARRLRWTVWSGGTPASVSRAGTRAWARADRAGTSSARRSRWTGWAPTSTSRVAAPT